MEQCNGTLDVLFYFVCMAGAFAGRARYLKEKSFGGVSRSVVELVGSEEFATGIHNAVVSDHLSRCCGHLVQGVDTARLFVTSYFYVTTLTALMVTFKYQIMK